MNLNPDAFMQPTRLVRLLILMTQTRRVMRATLRTLRGNRRLGRPTDRDAAYYAFNREHLERLKAKTAGMLAALMAA